MVASRWSWEARALLPGSGWRVKHGSSGQSPFGSRAGSDYEHLGWFGCPEEATLLRYTLLQARDAADLARDEEHAAFAARLSVDPSRIRCVDLLRTELTPGILDGSDALLVGGSGEYSVLDPLPSIRGFIDFLGEVSVSGFPTFASCFGFQALALALGGEVVSDVDRAEVGSYTLSLTDAGRKDPLFGALPPQFIAQLGHKDHVTSLPSGVEHLAGSERSPFQALRVSGKPIYATQFHPELTWKDNRQRYLRYMSTYGALFGEAEAQERLESHVPGPEANSLLAGFVRTVLS